MSKVTKSDLQAAAASLRQQLNVTRAERDSLAAAIDRLTADRDECMDLLGDVPGETLRDRVQKMVSYHLGFQVEHERLRKALELARKRIEYYGQTGHRRHFDHDMAEIFPAIDSALSHGSSNNG